MSRKARPFLGSRRGAETGAQQAIAVHVGDIAGTHSPRVLLNLSKADILEAIAEAGSQLQSARGY